MSDLFLFSMGSGVSAAVSWLNFGLSGIGCQRIVYAGRCYFSFTSGVRQAEDMLARRAIDALQEAVGYWADIRPPGHLPVQVRRSVRRLFESSASRLHRSWRLAAIPERFRSRSGVRSPPSVPGAGAGRRRHGWSCAPWRRKAPPAIAECPFRRLDA